MPSRRYLRRPGWAEQLPLFRQLFSKSPMEIGSNTDPTSESRVCPSCSTLDLTYYRENLGSVPPDLHLGDFEDLKQRAGVCLICSLIIGLIESQGKTTFRLRSIVIKPWDMGLEVYAEARTSNSMLLGDLVTFPAPNSSLAVNEGGGKIVSGRVLKHLLKTCEQQHISTCSKPTSLPGNQSRVRTLLVDVQKMCLVSVQPDVECRYIALSYVWGGRQMLRTTMENFSTLMRPGALAEHQEQIPRVIRDAMVVVSLMDERFLWVDTLCIVQDDPQLKHCEIARMNTIYSQASLTIIALSATHADQGLFGIPPKFRFPATICYQGVTIMRAAPQLDDLIAGSVYETRGWTLQEKVLSRRCLFFTDHLVYFRCNAGIHRETEDEPIVKLNGSVSARRANSVNPLTNLKGSIEALAWKHNFHHYKFLVRDYSKRNLSYPSDILFAFSGIQAHITAITGSDFVCGLPEAVIDAALLWYPLNILTSERRVSSIYTLDSSLIQPPSWSWIGWTNPVLGFLPCGLDPENSPFQVLVEKFDFESPKRIHTVRRDDRISVSTRKYVDTVTISDITTDTHVVPFKLGKELGTCFLLFSAEMINFYGNIHHEMSESRQIVRSWLSDSRGSRCVTMSSRMLSPKVVKSQMFHLIALSQRVKASRWLLRDLGLDKEDYRQYGLDDIVPGSVVNVMLIKWKTSQTLEDRYAERVAVGQMHEMEWMRMKPTRKAIRLG